MPEDDSADPEPAETEPAAPSDPSSFDLASWLRANRVGVAIVGGLLALVVIIVIATSGGDDSSDDATAPPVETDGAPEEPDTPPATGIESLLADDVEDVPCQELFELEEIDEALGLLDVPVSERDYFTFTKGETCQWTLASDEAVFLRIEPGSPGDFIETAMQLGVPGEPTDDVGDAASWFGGPDADGGGTSGMLSVWENRPIGALFFRVTVGRPDIDPDEQREVATQAALVALARFPGADDLEAELPVVDVTVEREEVDPSNRSLLDNIVAKEGDGEWTLGEGIVATLALMAGEVDAGDVLRDEELLDASGTPVIALARSYLAEEADDAERAEIERLLDALTFTEDELEALTNPPTDLEVQVASVRREGYTVVLAGSGPCSQLPPAAECITEYIDLDEADLDALYGEGQYDLFGPSQGTSGWNEMYMALVFAGMKEAAEVYEGFAKLDGVAMPRVDVYVWPFGSGAPAMSDGDDEVCSVNLYNPMQEIAQPVAGEGGTTSYNGRPDQFKQWIAREMGYCLIRATYPETVAGEFEVSGWWVDAFAVWLSTEVQPGADLEHDGTEALLRPVELTDSIVERGAENWTYFEHLDDELSIDDIFMLGRRFVANPSGGEDALASVDANGAIFHEYARLLTDRDLSDDGGGSVPYDPPSDMYQVTVGSYPFPLERFVTGRFHLEVAPGKTACITVRTTGPVQASHRPGRPGSGGAGWSQDMPDRIAGDHLFLATSTQANGQLSVRVTKLVDDPTECEPEEPDPPPTTEFKCELGCLNTEYFYKTLGAFFAQIAEAFEEALEGLGDIASSLAEGLTDASTG